MGVHQQGGGTMLLKRLELYGFRGIENLLIPFNGKSAVIFGVNGVGKSSILHGINILFSDLISKISPYRPGVSLTSDDVSFGRSQTAVQGQFEFDDHNIIIYYKIYYKKRNQKAHAESSLSEFAERYRKLYMEDKSPYENLPIFVNYGVNRSVLDVPVRIRTKHTFEKTSAFENAIQNRIDFRVFFEWFRNQEEFENAMKIEKQDFKYEDKALTAVRKSALAMLNGYDTLRIAHSPLRMIVYKGKKSISAEQLSDGEKCTLALFGDLARRLTIANPTMEDPLLGGGIVLIDEVELHMHPEWQRTVVPTLHQTFPNIQFIITTHSPQVLGELTDDFEIFHIARSENDRIVCSSVKPAYYDSNLVLEDYMGVASVNETVTKLESEISSAIESRNFNEARQSIQKLRNITNDTDPFITRSEVLLRRLEK